MDLGGTKIEGIVLELHKTSLRAPEGRSSPQSVGESSPPKHRRVRLRSLADNPAFEIASVASLPRNDDLVEVFRKRIDTQQEEGYEAILNRIKNLYEDLVKGAGLKGAWPLQRPDNGARPHQVRPEGPEAHTLGIGTPGAVSRRTGLLKNSNTVCMNGKPVRDDLKKLLQRDFVIENDANCFALAEALYGAGKGKNFVFGVIMGTGCGGGIVHQGKIVAGLQSIAGEWGHMSMDPRGPLCYCGARGCVETFISGGGLEKRYLKEFGQKKTLKEIVADYRKDKGLFSGVRPHSERGLTPLDTVCFMETFFKHYGRALANLINVLDPEIVVLGGGGSNIDELYTEGYEEVRKAVFSDSLETPIVKNQLGDSAGVIGAALIGN